VWTNGVVVTPPIRRIVTGANVEKRLTWSAWAGSALASR
jgi:hypothetical protein